MSQTENNLIDQPAATADAVIHFDPSQKRVFDDQSRVIAVNFHRQKGKDFVVSGKAVKSGMIVGQDWFITSLTQRQADATHDKCAKFFEAYRRLLKIKAKASIDEDQFEEYDSQIDHLFVRKSRILILPNGAKIVALPGKNPDTLAGLTGNVIFTEFGLFPGGGYEHWRVIFPLTTRGFSVMAISTPRSKKHKFFELCTDNEAISYHFCPLSKSVAEDGFILRDNKGRPCTIEEFKRLYHDDIGFAREYECQFTGDMDALIPWAQLLSAQEGPGGAGGIEAKLIRVIDGNGWRDELFEPLKQLPTGRFEWGWDVARKTDLASFAGNLAGRDGTKRLAALVVMKNCTFELQRHIIDLGMRIRPGSVGCGDATGMGMDSNETLKARFRDNWEPVTFTSKTKSELGSVGRTMFSDGTQKIPAFMAEPQWKFAATDLYSIQCAPVGDAADKRLQLDETENELDPDSHCDIAYSVLLAQRAGGMLGGKMGPGPGQAAVDAAYEWMNR